MKLIRFALPMVSLTFALLMLPDHPYVALVNAAAFGWSAAFLLMAHEEQA